MRVIPLVVAVATLVSTGCVSTITVKKASATTPGVRYYLPQVFLRVTPGIDGSMKVEPEYVPDPNHEYSIDASSYLSNSTVEINRNEKGFLEGVTFNSDSTAIAKQLLTTQANLRAAEIDAQAAKDKTDATEAKTAADKQSTALTAADKAQKDATLVVQVAEAKLKLLQDLEGQPAAPSNLKDQILAARIALSEAVVRRDAAQSAYDSMSTHLAAANGMDSKQVATAPGPVFLKVSMSEKDVKLVRAFDQGNFDTWKVPTAAAAPVELQLFPVEQVVRPAEKTGALTASVQSTKSLLSVELKAIVDQVTGAPLTFGPGKGPMTAIQYDRTTVRIDLPKTTPEGQYILTYLFKVGPQDKPEPKTQILRLRVER